MAYIRGFPGGSDGKAFACNEGDLGSINLALLNKCSNYQTIVLISRASKVMLKIFQ